MTRPLYLIGWGYAVIAAALAYRGAHPETFGSPLPGGFEVLDPAARWFAEMKPRCNPVEVSVAYAQNPAPAGWTGQGYGAACFALAGRTGRAQELIEALPEDDRWRAAGVVFEAGHSVADAGDDASAGPIMELVLRYWPNNYMALYHAGMAQYRLGQNADARRNLESFLREYQPNDGWRTNAREVLDHLPPERR